MCIAIICQPTNLLSVLSVNIMYFEINPMPFFLHDQKVMMKTLTS